MSIYNRQITFYTKSNNDHVTDSWYHLKEQCENGEQYNKHFVKDWLDKCEIETNKNLTILDRCEGGVCDKLDKEKQIRFRNFKNNVHQSWCHDNEIVLDVYDSTNNVWTREEIGDLMRAFILFANEFVNAECVHGYVVI